MNGNFLAVACIKQYEKITYNYCGIANLSALRRIHMGNYQSYSTLVGRDGDFIKFERGRDGG